MLEPSIVKEYTSPRGFSISEVVGRGVLVLRNEGGMFMGDGIDLVFLGLDYLNLPAEISDFRIWQPCDAAAIELEREFGVKRKGEEPEGKRVFRIECPEGKFHVIASKMWVIVRAPGGSSLKALFSEISGEREKFIEEKMREWLKMSAIDC